VAQQGEGHVLFTVVISQVSPHTAHLNKGTYFMPITSCWDLLLLFCFLVALGFELELHITRQVLYCLSHATTLFAD
jgi:hypothetical protein